MKNLLLILIVSVSGICFGQIPPNAFNYSAVARDAQSNPIANQTIGIQISILQTSTLGAVQYQENHFVNTDDFGLFNLIIGAGAIQSGTMSTIAWSTDNFYLKVGMDVNGSTNFLTMGTTQLLSVPYALHAATADSLIGGASATEADPIFAASLAAEITQTDTTNWNTDIDSTNELQTISISNDTIYLSNGGFALLPATPSNATGGKTYIELFDDVTDAEAIALLASDLGPNTQFVYITNTTNLTTVDLTGINSLIELRIENNSALTSVTTPSITRVSQNLNVQNNPLLSTFQMDNATVLGTTTINNNAAMTALSFANLTRAGNLTIGGNASLSTLAVASLTTANYVDIYNNGLTSLDFSGLTTLTGNGYTGLTISGNASLSTLAAASLSSASHVNILGNGLTSVDLSGLTNLTGSFSISGNASLTTLTAASLSTANSISIIYNNGLTSIDFSGLTTVTDVLEISDNLALTDIVWSGSVAWSYLLQVINCALPDTEINEILALAVANGSGNPITIDLSGQTPPAPPSGQGITDVGILQGWGFSVITD